MSRRSVAASTAIFPLADLPFELQSLVVEQMPLRTMARLALTRANWAEMVLRCMLAHRPWARSYACHRCSHDLTAHAHALVAPPDTWAWTDHLHVLEAVAVRQHPSEFAWLIEAVVGTEWWSSKLFDEEAVARAASRCLVGRAAGGVTPQTVLDLFNVFLVHRNPGQRIVHCTAEGEHEHNEECGGFCSDNEMATRAWSLRALTKPLNVSDAAVVGRCLTQWQLSPYQTAMFLLSYFGSVWEIWDFTPADASRLAALAAELRLDGATVAALISRLAAEEEAFRDEASAGTPPFMCTLTLLLEWAQAVHFPGSFPPSERKHVLRALAMQAHRPGFKAAARPVLDLWSRMLAATGLACAPCAS